MNNHPYKDFSPSEMKEILDSHVFHMWADVTDRVLGPVIESDYDVINPQPFYGETLEEGMHRITSDLEGNPIAYSGPGEEG
jgi:hypothetical protein